MERLAGEARDRVRAMGLWLVAALLLGGVLTALFAIFIGFAQVSPATIHAVVPGPDGRELAVHYSAGSPDCDRLHRVEVTETGEVVELRVHTSTRQPLRGRACRAIDEAGQVDVVLGSPLAGRTVRDGEREVPVSDAWPGPVSSG